MFNEEEYSRVDVKGVYVTSSGVGMAPVVLLEDTGGRILQIFIGVAEALSIHSALNNEIAPRPMTHDLFVSVLDRLKVDVEKIVVDDLNEGIFYARMFLKIDGEEVEVDARPSDSIAIALRTRSDIFVRTDILDTVGVTRDELKNFFSFEDEMLE
jgi:hypothetical protein